MKKPSLEQVKEHFKNAKTIKDFRGVLGRVVPEDIIQSTPEFDFCYTQGLNSDGSLMEGYGCYLVLWDYKGYAEIVEHKEMPIPDVRFKPLKGAGQSRIRKHITPDEEIPEIEYNLTFIAKNGVYVILRDKDLDKLFEIAKKIQ